MQVTKTVEETRKQIKAWKKEGKTVGLVPTMGFLHEGHASLIKKCREQNDIVVVSDFVNPTQFGPTEDLEAYPRDFERDSKLCESLGADLIFCPEPSEMYHDPHAFVSIDTLSETLCGKTRPIHFKGCMHSSVQAVPHRSTGQSIFRTERRTAAGYHPQDGAGSEL